MKNWLYKWYPLILILSIGAIFRFAMLKFRGDFTFDEMFSVRFSSLSWSESLRYWIIETNPPLYNFLLRYWLKIWPVQEWLVRLPSLIFGLLTILMVYVIGLKFFNKKTGIIAALLISLSSLNIYLSTEARAYSLFLLLTAFSIYLFLALMSEKETSYKKIILYIGTQTLLLYTHLTAVLMPILQILVTLLSAQEDKRAKRIIFYSNFVSAIFFSIWFLPSLLNKLTTNTLNGWYFSQQTGQPFFFALATLFLNPNASAGLMTFFIIFMVFILGAGSLIFLKKIKTKEIKPSPYLFLFSLTLVPPLLALIVGINGSKYFSLSLPALSLLFGWTISQYKEKRIALSLTLIASLLLLPSALDTSTTTFFSWQPIINYIHKNETKTSLILINPFNEELDFTKYYQGSTPSKGIYLRADNLSLNERIVRYNWQIYPTIEADLDLWLKKQTADKSQVFLIQYTLQINKLSLQWFLKNGWQLVDWKKTGGKLNLFLFDFHAPNFNTTTSTIQQ